MLTQETVERWIGTAEGWQELLREAGLEEAALAAANLIRSLDDALNEL